MHTPTTTSVVEVELQEGGKTKEKTKASIVTNTGIHPAVTTPMATTPEFVSPPPHLTVLEVAGTTEDAVEGTAAVATAVKKDAIVDADETTVVAAATCHVTPPPQLSSEVAGKSGTTNDVRGATTVMALAVTVVTNAVADEHNERTAATTTATTFTLTAEE